MHAREYHHETSYLRFRTELTDACYTTIVSEDSDADGVLRRHGLWIICYRS